LNSTEGKSVKNRSQPFLGEWICSVDCISYNRKGFCFYSEWKEKGKGEEKGKEKEKKTTKKLN